MQITTQNERLQAFQALDTIAAQCFQRSQEELSGAIVALNTIREEALYMDGGFKTWNDYLRNFMETNGVSRSLAYENLAVARLARGAGFDSEEIVEFGLVTLKPWFARDGPVLRYNRKTGEITKVVEAVEQKMPEGDNYSTRYGMFVRERVSEGEPPSLVWQTVRSEMSGLNIMFGCFVSDGKLAGLSWSMENGDEYAEGKIMFSCSPDLPEEIVRELLDALRVSSDWR